MSYDIKAAFLFIRDIFIFYRTYYLYVRVLNEIQMSDDPRIKDFVLKIISTRQEYDTLISKGYDFNPWHYKFSRRLNKGAIALCIFVDKELAHMHWVAVSNEGQKSIGEYPIKADFAHNESIAGDYWTRPVYRGVGLAPYAIGKMAEYLKELGKTVSKGAIRKDNTASLNVLEKRKLKDNSIMYAEGRHWNILGLKFWKETLVNTEQ